MLMTMRSRSLLSLLFILCLGGCATVLPFQRELLAREDMKFDGNAALSTAEAHAVGTREGSLGGFGGGGGGCGCN